MGIRVTKTTGTTYNPVFLKILEVIPGGGNICTDRVPSWCKELKKGALLQQSADTTGIWHFIKSGKSLKTQTAATAMEYVADVSLFNVGDYIGKYGATTGSTITRVTRTANTTTIATGTAIGTLATASKIFEVDVAGTTGQLYTATAMLGETVRVRDDDLTTVDNVTGTLVVRAGVSEDALPYYITAADKTGLGARFWFE